MSDRITLKFRPGDELFYVPDERDAMRLITRFIVRGAGVYSTLKGHMICYFNREGDLHWADGYEEECCYPTLDEAVAAAKKLMEDVK